MALNDVTVVLVHGAWADGSSWRKVIALLRGRGMKAVAAPLPLTTFGDDTAALNRVLDRIDGPVVLAGHAYGGAVIGSTHDEKVKALVYIAALAPDHGETVADVFYRGAAHPQAPQLAPDRDGLIWLPDDAFAAAFAQQASADELAVLAAVQRPISAACIGVPIEGPLWRERPNWYLVAEHDRMINPETQVALAMRMNARVHSHAVDHSPMIATPQVVTQIIVEAADAVGSR
jgi:pimeloyl-ACP methyl ester carboxylesterase